MSEDNRYKYGENGRVDLAGDAPFKAFPTWQESDSSNKGFEQEAIDHIQTPTRLSNVYFSPQNIDALQQGIRYLVWKRSNEKFVIGRQSDTQLKLVMRGTYFQHAKNLDYDVVGQVKGLNKLVLDEVVPTILTNVEQHKGYIRDVTTMQVPMARSENLSVKGTRTLYTKEF